MAEATSRTGPSSGCDGEEARQPSVGNRVISPHTPASLFFALSSFFFLFFGFDVCLVCPNVFFGALQIGDANRPDGAVLWSRRGGMQNSPKLRLTPPPPHSVVADATSRIGLVPVATGRQSAATHSVARPTRPAGRGSIPWSRRGSRKGGSPPGRRDQPDQACSGRDGKEGRQPNARTGLFLFATVKAHSGPRRETRSFFLFLLVFLWGFPFFSGGVFPGLVGLVVLVHLGSLPSWPTRPAGHGLVLVATGRQSAATHSVAWATRPAGEA